MLLSTTISEKKPLQLKDGNKFHSKFLSKESSSSNPSFRVYYALDSVAIPFLWESQPGKPKSTTISSTSLLPPLTPPPSYCSNPSDKGSFAKKPSKFNILHFILPKISIRKIHMPSLLCFRLQNGAAGGLRRSYSAEIMAQGDSA